MKKAIVGLLAITIAAMAAMVVIFPPETFWRTIGKTTLFMIPFWATYFLLRKGEWGK